MTGLASHSVEALLRSRDSTGRTEPVEVHTDALDHSDLGPRQRARGQQVQEFQPLLLPCRDQRSNWVPCRGR